MPLAKKKAAKVFKFPRIKVAQGGHELFLFSAPAHKLWSFLSINEKIEDKDEGYQRVLSPSRTRAIARYVDAKHPIPLSILVTLEKDAVKDDGSHLVIKDRPSSGWVIDGQHRLAGAHEADLDIDIPVVAFIGLSLEEQVQQFVTINREAKGVPTSLYYDLMRQLPNKTKPGDFANERAADIANELRREEDSPFFGRIVVTTAPKRGQISLANFVRKVAPLVYEGKGVLHPFTPREQRHIIGNYYIALKNVFPKEFTKGDSVFFQTIGFGALMNALGTFFLICFRDHKAFRVEDATKIFKEIQHFDFSEWRTRGTGSSAEIQSGDDLKAELSATFDRGGIAKGTIDV